MATTQDLLYPNGSTLYYSNCRGTNYLPIMQSEWEKSGYLPRNPFIGYDTSVAFLGTNKTTQWVYYNHNDNVNCVEMLRSVGFNAIRVFTDIYVWNRNKNLFMENIKDFLRICDKNKMRVQFVIFDGVNITPYDEPQNRAETVSSVENGLLSGWQGIPHRFELSSQAQTDNFFATCATPYLTHFAQTVSSHQSFWSFDLCNEFGLDAFDNFVYLTELGCQYVSSILPTVGITFGYGAGCLPYPNPLTNGSGTGPGGRVVDYPNPTQELSSVINFVSIHPYNNNKLITRFRVDEAVSNAILTGRPAMYNELSNPDSGALFPTMMGFFKDFGMGGLYFDGLRDFYPSHEPFAELQGLFYWDRQINRLFDASSIARLSFSSNWFSPTQLKYNHTVKATSLDGGVDQGFWSGVVPQHREFIPNVYVSANQALWETTKAIIYASNPDGSKNYPPNPGHPLSNSESMALIVAVSGLQFRDYYNMLYNHTNFRPLADFPDAESGPDFVARNNEILLRNKIVEVLGAALEVDRRLPGSQLIGSQYDPMPFASSHRLSFSGISYPLLRLDGSSISPVTELTIQTGDDKACLENETCLYIDNNPANALDWEAYDEFYASCFDSLIEFFDLLEATEDPRYDVY